MKKVLRGIMFVVLMLSTVLLTACNQNIGIGKLDFKYVYDIPHDCYYAVSSWHDNEIGIEIHTKGYGTMYFSEGTYILYSQKPDDVTILER